MSSTVGLARSNSRWTVFRRHENVGAGVLMLAAALMVYLPAVYSDGWYIDDWAMVAQFHDAASQSLGGLIQALGPAPGGRMLASFPATLTYYLGGGTAAAFHVTAMLVLALCATAVFVLLRRLRLPVAFALVAAVLFIAYPGSDATRLWPVGSTAEWVLAGYLAGVLLGLAAIGKTGWRAIALHALSAAIFVVLFLMNEAVVSVVAVTGLFYVGVFGLSRPAVIRGLVDLVLAVGFALLRLTVLPVPPASGFMQHRTPVELVSRVVTC